MKSLVHILLFSLLTTTLAGQQPTRLDSAMHRLSQEKDPQRTVMLIDAMIREFRLDKKKDQETLDVLYGTAAVKFAIRGNYPQFEKYIVLIRNKFNQTSFLNMAASEMLNSHVDASYANRISKRTLDLYQAIRNDTSARPKDFSLQDWQRFMSFAQYPYYDTYAQSLFALKRYREALPYQQKAFNGSPEDGIPASVERYAKLLELTGKRDQAKDLLLRRARLGKLNKGMTAQLQAIYIAEKGSDRNLGAYLDSLGKNVQASLVQELRPKMLDEVAPGFTLKDIKGRTVKLADYAGRTVVIDLWATWCRPCIASFPAMELVVKKHPEVSFLFIAVEQREADPMAAVKTFIEKNKYPFTVLVDEPVAPRSEQHKIISAYRPDGIPAKYIVDKNGMLRFRTAGFDSDTELMNELEAMLSMLQ